MGHSFVGPLPWNNDPLVQVVAPGSGPTAELSADPLVQSLAGSYSFKVIYRDDAAVRVSTIDSFDIYVYGPNGYVRRATLVSVDINSNGPVRVARYKVGPPGGTWDAPDNGWYTVMLQPNQVTDIYGVAANSGIIGQFKVQVVGVGGPQLPRTPSFGVSVTAFGAIPNDGIDDSAAIQAAIDSLPVSDGAPIGDSPAGGVVLFPAGTFDIAHAIELHSGITLRGAGNNTILHSISTDRNGTAIELVSPFSHHFTIGVTIERMTIYARWGSGIRSVNDPIGDIIDLRLADLRISALGPAIDLRCKATYHSDIDNVEVYNPGSTALFLGRTDGAGADNRIRNFKVTGAVRSGFRAERGLVMLMGDMIVQGMSIRATGGNAVPLYVAGDTTFTAIDLQVPAANCPGGIALLAENCSRVEIESINNIGTGRRIKLIDVHDVQIYNVITDGTTTSYAQVMLIDSRSYARVSNNIAGTLVHVTPVTVPPSTHVRAPMPTNIIDVTQFGADGDDNLDDTAAIQAAIDSLPRGNGIPGGTQTVGGIVQFPVGRFQTSAPIRVPSGVWLRGMGNGTIIANTCLDATSSTIELYSPYTHGSNIGAAVIDMGICMRRARAIVAGSSITGTLTDLKLAGLRITSDFNVSDAHMATGIDLRNVVVSYLDLDRVVFCAPGSTAFWLGKSNNSSNNNTIRGMRMVGDARPGFVPERALWVIYGTNTTIEGGSLEDTNPDNPVLPMYASGSMKMTGFYMEFPYNPTGLAFVFENMTSLQIDRLYHINPQRRLSLINVADARISNLNIDGTTSYLRDCISVDEHSKLTLQAVQGQWDSGMLDHPRVLVQGFYNKTAGNFVETKVATSGNFLKDPNFNSVGDDIWNVSDWQIIWGDGYSGRLGSFSVETVGGVKRLRLDVPDTTPVSIRIRLNVPTSAIGKNAIARWRIDGNTQAFVYLKGATNEFVAHAMKGMTAARSTRTIEAGEEIWVGLPAAKGTYYFSRFGIVSI